MHAGTVNLLRTAGSLVVLMIWLYFSAGQYDIYEKLIVSSIQQDIDRYVVD